MNISGSERRDSKRLIVEKYLLTAFNYRMTDVQAAMGCSQLRQLPEFVEKRRKIDGYYHAYFGDISWLELPFEPHDVRSNWQSYSIRVLPHAPRSRDGIIRYLFNQDICCIPGIRNAYWENPYAHVSNKLPASHEAQASEIIFPLYVNLTKEDIKRIAALLRKLNQGRRPREAKRERHAYS
jgi:dTDP-4-amino-4,6-dideoxygalactose transaminase